MKEEKRISEIIRSCSLLEGIEPDCFHPVYHRCKRGEEISDTFEERQYVGIIGSGEADVYTLADMLSQPNVSTQKAGSIFGICNVYSDQHMPTKLVCRVGCEIVFLPKDEFKEQVRKNALLQERYLKLCNQKIVYLAQKIELMGITQSRVRLAFYLLQNRDDMQTVRLNMSKEQFARFLNISRASLFRGLAEFEEKGYIICEENAIHIQNVQALSDVRAGIL